LSDVTDRTYWRHAGSSILNMSH